MKTMADVLNEHAFHLITPVRLDDVNGSWQVECTCTDGPFQGPSFLAAEQAFAAHQSEALEIAGYGSIRKAQAEVLRDVVDDFSVNLTTMSGPRIRSWLSARADDLAAGE